MVALLRHQPVRADRPAHGAIRGGVRYRRAHLHLAGAGAGAGAGAACGRSAPGRPGALRVVPAPADPPVAPSLVVVAAVGVVVFGLLGVIRLLQGAPAEVPAGSDRVAASVVADPPVVDTARGDRLVVVGPGDSLWSIARDAAPGRDPRPLVAALIEVNDGASLQIGQQIVIPGQLLD